MRFLLYNIRYGTGGKARLPWAGYFRRTSSTLSQIAGFLSQHNADIIGLIEVDAGSFRSNRLNQAETLSSALGHYHTYKSKYRADSAMHCLPLMNKQGNAFLTRDTITNAQFHYFTKGVKRLVIELEMEDWVIFLVHLALTFRVRHRQLSDLCPLIRGTDKPLIVAGDFNAFWGDKELDMFLAATKLKNANTHGLPTFPSWHPKRQLDLVLHSPGIHINRFDVPRVAYSDHLPLVVDFTVE